MSYILFGGAVGFAVLDWFAVYKAKKQIEKFAKPLTIILLFLFVLNSANTSGKLSSTEVIWFLVGMALCLIGDVFLFLPPERWFLIGLVAFLLGHVGYILSFGVFSIDSVLALPAALLGMGIILVGMLVDKRLIASMIDKGKSKMIVPIVIYSVVISFMLYSAGFKFLDSTWELSEALLLAAGALLFYISDILNAWERFVSKFNNDRFIIMMTYHLGQFGLATGMVLHFS